MSKKNRNKIKAIRSQIAEAPQSPGVYLFIGPAHKVLYVGKAKHVRKRLTQHFSRATLKREAKKTLLLQKIQTIQWFPTPSEDDAFFVENQYIKKYQPPFNVLMRDDKSFPYLRISLSHPFPKLGITRRIGIGEDRIIGPFRSGALIRQMIEICIPLFKVRSCSDHFFRVAKRPCMEYQLKRCEAPCVGYVDADHYQAEINQMLLFLTGKEKQLLKEMRGKMQALSKQDRFLEAAGLRNHINTIEQFLNQGRDDFTGVEGHSDFIVLEQGKIGVCHVRFGIISGMTVPEKNHSLSIQTETECIENLLMAYGTRLVIPNKIYLPFRLAKQQTIRELIFRQGGEKPKLCLVKKSHEKQIMKYLKDQLKSKDFGAKQKLSFRRDRLPMTLAQDLADFCKCDRLPKRFEAIDISHFQGAYTVGAVVVFDLKGPVKASYRYYKIKGIAAQTGSKINDTAAIAEVCERRYSKSTQGRLPDVLLIDGGKGQLRAAQQVIQKLKLSSQVRVMSLSKNRKPGGTDFIHFDFSEKRLRLAAVHPVYRFLTWMRDESHRFCNNYQKRKFQKAMKTGSL
jgi:excinuclease ABC subunit C